MLLSVLLLAAAAAPSTSAVQDGDAPVLPAHAPIVFGDDAANGYVEPFFPGATYDPDVATPESILGQPAGSRIASHDEVLRILEALERTSDRVVLRRYGSTYEGRPLVAAIITSPGNHARLDDVAAAARGLRDTDLDAEEWLARGVPAIAWMGYGIHGDETSATEAAPSFAYHLAASQDASVVRALERVVVVLDPCLNPDGRERIRSMVVQGAGFRANLDDGAMQRGRWPGGRGNHYLFDMNRDWMAGEAPETRARWRILAELPPQLFVDAHEMGGMDTFLFYPQADPRNRHLPEQLDRWQRALAAGAAETFDRYGWGYYTREWADALYPGYSDAWGSLNGAVGMLYEQGRTIGAPLERESGEIVAYRESVHGQIAASFANLTTFSELRDGIVRDYAAHRARGSSDLTGLDGDAFVVRPSGDVERDARFIRALQLQTIRVEVAREPFEVAAGRDLLGAPLEDETFGEGTWIIRAAQPSGALVRTYLEFDPRLDEAFLNEERADIEQGRGSGIYDVSAWNLARQMGVDGAWVELPGDVSTRAAEPPTAPRGPVGGDLSGAYAWIADAPDTRSIRFAAQALEAGLQVHVSDEPFTATVRGEDGEATTRTFQRGSFLLRRHENEAVEDVDGAVQDLAGSTGARVHAAVTGRAAGGEGPDLGGGHFDLLTEARAAIVTNSPVSPDDFGHLWRAVDEELGIPLTLLDAQGWRSVDLARYNVLIVPPGGGGFLREREASIADWVEDGGTLIAVGSSAHAIAREGSRLGSNRLRRDVLEDLDAYAWRTAKERASMSVSVDVGALYGDAPAPDGEGDDEREVDAEMKDPEGVDDDADPEALDEWRRRFSPAAVILRGELDPTSWLTAGCGDVPEMPVLFGGSFVLFSNVRPAVRLAAEGSVRLGGLLWPEARARVADSAWATVERVGRGQVVSFAASPVFRGSWRGTMRLFLNAVVVGPGSLR